MSVSLHLPKQYRNVCVTPPAQTTQECQRHCGQEKQGYVLNSTFPNNTRLSVTLWTGETQLYTELHLSKQYNTISIAVDKKNMALC